MERNRFLESDGLSFESETHEWFADKSSTHYAQNENMHGVALKKFVAYVVRDKDTGEYNRVLIDHNKNEIVYDTKSIEEMGVHIDQLKAIILFNKTDN